MFIPRGVPEHPNATTEREVKSGLRKTSFSNSLGHGDLDKKKLASLTTAAVFSDCFLSTTAYIYVVY